jgi:hypothetical protein
MMTIFKMGPDLRQRTNKTAFGKSIFTNIINIAMKLSKTQTLGTLLVFLILMACYLPSLAPGLTWAHGGADGGDLITAVALNGVPHPSGYPLYLLLAKPFLALPLGNLAFRANLFSAFCFALASALLFNVSLQWLQGRQFALPAAAAAALSFGLSPLVWSQAVIAEVYGLQALLTVIILLQSFSCPKTRVCSLLRGLTLGLALGNHLTSLFLLPLLFFDFRSPGRLSFRDIVIRLLGFLMGCLVYLILPLYAAQSPPVNWMGPVAWSSFWDLVSGRVYQSYFTLDLVGERMRGIAGLLLRDFTLLGVPLGIFALFRSPKDRFSWSLFWLFFIHGLFSLVYGSKDSYVYLIVAWVAFSLWIGQGVQWVLASLPPRKYLPLMVSLALAAFFIARAFLIFPQVDASQDHRAEDFAQRVLENAPHGALLLAVDDEASFVMGYYLFVENHRPDLTLISEGLLSYSWYQHSLRSQDPGLVLPSDNDSGAYELIMLNARPYCWVKGAAPSRLDCFHF